MSFETISEQRCFGGVQGFYRHESAEGQYKLAVLLVELGRHQDAQQSMSTMPGEFTALF